MSLKWLYGLLLICSIVATQVVATLCTTCGMECCLIMCFAHLSIVLNKKKV